MVRSDDPGRWDDDEAGPEEPEPGDPVEAFDALRRRIEEQGAQLGAEMAVIRRGLEAAFEQLEKIEPVPDYRPEIGKIVKQLGTVGARLQAVEAAPVLQHGPDHYARQMAQAGSSLVREATEKIDSYSSELRQTTRTLSGYVDGARTYERQNWWLVGAAGAGIIFGVVLTLALPSILPGRVAPWVASLVMGQAPADAGRAMIQSGDPARYGRMVWAEWIFANNVEALESCVADMQQSGQDRSCTVVVKAPEP